MGECSVLLFHELPESLANLIKTAWSRSREEPWLQLWFQRTLPEDFEPGNTVNRRVD